MTGYAKKFNENTTISFRANNKQFLKNQDKIWEKVERLIKINFKSKPVYGDNDKYIKTKIKIYADNMIINFHNKKMPKEKAPCKCLSIIMLDSVIKANKKYYSQTFLEECKYVQEKIKIENHIDEELEKSESDSDFNDETQSDIDNDEYDQQILKKYYNAIKAQQCMLIMHYQAFISVILSKQHKYMSLIMYR